MKKYENMIRTHQKKMEWDENGSVENNAIKSQWQGDATWEHIILLLYHKNMI